MFNQRTDIYQRHLLRESPRRSPGRRFTLKPARMGDPGGPVSALSILQSELRRPCRPLGGLAWGYKFTAAVCAHSNQRSRNEKFT